MRWVFALWFTTLVLCGGPRAARAQTEPDDSPSVVIVTREEGAESCPDTPTLAEHVARVRGHQATGETSAYRVSFSHRGGVFRATIQSNSGTGTRVLRDRGATCASLEQATSLTLALLIDSDTREPSPEPEPPPPEPVEPPPPPPPAPSRAAVSLSMSFGAGGLFGVVQPVVPVALGELGIGIDRFRTNLGVLWMPSTVLDFGPGALHETLLGGVARTCLSAWRGQHLRFDLCSGIVAGLLKVEAHGYTTNGTAKKPWLAVPVGLALSSTATPVGAELGVSALLPLRRNDFSIDHLGIAYESWPVGMLISLRAVGSWLL